MSRKPHEPTKQSRDWVLVNYGLGAPQADLAEYLKIDIKTLRKHYKNELIEGRMDAFTEVSGALYKAAVEDGNVAAQKFYLGSKHGWSEKTVTETYDMTPKVIKDNIPDVGLN